MNKQEKHSLWLCPDEEGTTLLAGIIAEVASQYHTPLFSPHVTLLPGSGEIEGKNLDTLFSTAIAQRIPPFALRFNALAFGKPYFKCLYMTIARSNKLVELFTTINAQFTNRITYNDLHLSLAYGLSVPVPDRDTVTKKIAHMVNRKVLMSKIQLVKTQGNLENWNIIREYRLERRG